MELHVIQREFDGGIATITLNRPDRLNSWSGRMHTEYRHALSEAESDPTIKVIVVTGAGRGFCAGADMSALDGHIERGAYDDGVPEDVANPGYGVRDDFDHPFAFHFGMRKPIIAKVNGPAAGVGLVLACFCDVRFVADDAKLTTAAPRLGLPAEYGLSWLLPRLVGVGQAADLLISGRIILGQEAAEMGLANKSMPATELDDHVTEYASAMVRGISPMAMAEAKRQMYVDLHQGLGPAIQTADASLRRMVTEADFAEGVAAFQAKRPPDFKGLPRD